MKGKPWYSFILVTAAAAWLPQPAAGQLFNIDVDLPGEPYLGGGVPSPSFGAAAGQHGFWNNLNWGREAPLALRDIAGAATSAMVSMRAVNSNSGLGYNFTANTGDYALLLNDAAQVGDAFKRASRTYTFSGLAVGEYEVYAYAVAPHGGFRRSLVSVEGSSTPNPQVVTGPMPGNRFEAGITHSLHHDVAVTNGTLIVTVEAVGGEQDIGWVNGFQIVPEPSTGLALLLPLAWVVGRVARRRSLAGLFPRKNPSQFPGASTITQ